MSDSSDITIIDAGGDGSGETETTTALKRLQRIENPTSGLITGVKRIPVPADEPNIEAYVVEREDFTPLTDGQTMSHDEGGAAFTDAAALVATYGEAIERYCGCIYREADFQTAAYTDLSEPALDPTAVVHFSRAQQEAMDSEADLCGTHDELSWIGGVNLDTGMETLIPAQLVYLSYPPESNPFVRNPISSGLAAGESREMAIHNGLYELIERDAFMIYYLTETELPVLDPESASQQIRRLIDRVTTHGLELTLLDATTDLGVPIVIAVLIDRKHRPAVSVAAAAGPDVAAVIERALSEVAQTRLSAIHRLDATDRSPDDIAAAEITDYADRARYWSPQERIDDLDFWIESDRETSIEAVESDATTQNPVEQVTAAGYDLYTVDVTTRDVSNLGFTVQRVVAPRLQPLYLVERLRYFGGQRLYEVPVEMGYRETQPSEADLNTVPHPFP